MKSAKHIALSIVLTLSVFCAVLYPSCSKDACKGVTCLNAGTCSGGACTCLPGIGGNNCQTVYRLLYDSTYAGIATYSTSYTDSATGVDTSYIIRVDTGNTLVFSVGPDSVYTQMQLVWNRPNGQSAVSMPNIILTSFSANGSTFTASGSADTFNYSGTGTVNGSTASLNLVGSHPVGPSVIVTLNNLAVQQ